MSNSYSKLADYFERRAARARNVDRRSHYLEIAKKYRRQAAAAGEPRTAEPRAAETGAKSGGKRGARRAEKTPRKR
jgi:hypothetical protein